MVSPDCFLVGCDYVVIWEKLANLIGAEAKQHDSDKVCVILNQISECFDISILEWVQRVLLPYTTAKGLFELFLIR